MIDVFKNRNFMNNNIVASFAWEVSVRVRHFWISDKTEIGISTAFKVDGLTYRECLNDLQKSCYWLKIYRINMLKYKCNYHLNSFLFYHGFFLFARVFYLVRKIHLSISPSNSMASEIYCSIVEEDNFFTHIEKYVCGTFVLVCADNIHDNIQGILL